MKRASLLFVLLSVLCRSAFAQPALSEPGDFPNTFGGPIAVQSSSGCFWLATGSLEPGDVDWVQVTLPFAATRTVIDLDKIKEVEA